MLPSFLITLSILSFTILSLSLSPMVRGSWLFGGSGKNEFPTEYGVDVTFPIHHDIDQSRYAWQANRYQQIMKGCYDKYSFRECDANERDRLRMNEEQPSTQHNYTDLGFKKLRLPDAVWKDLRAFYDANKDKEKVENWPRGNTYVNHWDSPSYMISLEDRSLRGAALSGSSLKSRIWDGVKPILEEWTGHQLEPTSLYGIRVYKNGAVLAPHVDRLPLVTSCIIQVDQEVNEPWPIEVYDHDGNAHNVTMQPGDMVLYESHTVIHGRPFPMNGTRYANVFVHFQPVDHAEMNNEDHERMDGHAAASVFRSEDRHVGGHEQSNHQHQRRQGREREDAFRRRLDRPLPPKTRPTALLDDQQMRLRLAVIKGDVRGLQAMLEKDTSTVAGEGEREKKRKALLEQVDENEWRLFHESVRAGNVDMMKLLISYDIDRHAKVKNGHNAIWIAQEMLPKGSERQKQVMEYLESIGVKNEEPVV